MRLAKQSFALLDGDDRATLAGMGKKGRRAMIDWREQVTSWIHAYGYHAVVPILVADPAGVPWAWIFLMMLAEEARLNSWLLLGYGFAVLTINDHLLYCSARGAGGLWWENWARAGPKSPKRC